MLFSEKLLELRRAKALSQENLADMVGVSRQAVSKWETGEAMPDLNKLLALGDALDVSLDQLCGREAGQDTTENTTTLVVQKKNVLWPILCGVLTLVVVALLLQMIHMSRTMPDGPELSAEVSVVGVDFSSSNGHSLSYRVIPNAINGNYTYELLLHPESPVFGAPGAVVMDLSDGVFQGKIDAPLSASHYWTVTMRISLDEQMVVVPVATKLSYRDPGVVSWEQVQ